MATTRTTGKHEAIPVELAQLGASVHHLSLAVDALLEEVRGDRDARADVRVKLALLEAAVESLRRAAESGQHIRPNRKQAAVVAASGAGLGAGSITLWEIVQRLLGG